MSRNKQLLSLRWAVNVPVLQQYRSIKLLHPATNLHTKNTQRLWLMPSYNARISSRSHRRMIRPTHREKAAHQFGRIKFAMDLHSVWMISLIQSAQYLGSLFVSSRSRNWAGAFWRSHQYVLSVASHYLLRRSASISPRSTVNTVSSAMIFLLAENTLMVASSNGWLL